MHPLLASESLIKPRADDCRWWAPRWRVMKRLGFDEREDGRRCIHLLEASGVTVSTPDYGERQRERERERESGGGWGGKHLYVWVPASSELTCAAPALKALINKATVASHFSHTGIHGLAMTFASFESRNRKCYNALEEWDKVLYGKNSTFDTAWNFSDLPLGFLQN